LGPVACPDGAWAGDGLRGAAVVAASRWMAPAVTRIVIASVLEVPSEAFDVETVPVKPGQPP